MAKHKKCDIMISGMVTYIAKKLEIINKEILKKDNSSEVISLDDMVAMGMVEKIGNTYQLAQIQCNFIVVQG